MKPLAGYLNDHVTGSAAALDLIRTLADHDPQDAGFYLCLREDIARNRHQLVMICRSLGIRLSPWRDVLGRITSKAGQLKLAWTGLAPGKPGLLEALEVLALGIQGQLLLWITLKELAPGLSLDDAPLADLIRAAEKQKLAVERKHLSAAKRALSPHAAGREAA